MLFKEFEKYKGFTWISPLGAKLNRPRQDFLGDLRVRHGIKLGLGGLLAMFCAQALRLPDDQWSILTLLVLMNGQYVGAFAFKGVIRLTGTIVGAVVGVWLVSDYASTPAVFLTLFFFVMALAGYKYGQVGPRQRPYVYFLVGLTTVTVAGDAITTPGRAWQIGLYRTEEIFVGIVCSLLVSNLVWPRYAREEFFEAGRGALKTVSQLFSIHACSYISAGDALFENAPKTVPRLCAPRTPSSASEIEQLHHALDQQLARLRNLLQAGARESVVFSARLANYNAFMVALNNLFQTGLALHRHRGGVWFLEHLQSEIESVCAAISHEFEILTRPASPGEKLPPGLINETFARLEEKVNQIRTQGTLLKAPLGTVLDFAGEFALLRCVRDELNDVRAAVEGLPRRFGPSSPDDSPEVAARLNSPKSLAKSEKRQWDILPAIDWFWVKAGIKGGLAALIALFFLRWIHPPGAPNVPTWAWIFTILRGGFFRLGSGSDLRSFRTAVCGSFFLVGCTFLLIIITPLLTSYAVMNLVLFLALFATGFFTAKYTAISFWSEFTFLTLSALVALNPQVPVSSQTIIDTFIGTIFGLWIATVISRLIWPILPQRILRDSLVTLLAQIKALLAGDPNPEKALAQLTNLPLEALEAIRQMRVAGCSEEERTKLVAVVRNLQILINRTGQLVRRRLVLRSLGEGGPVLHGPGEGGDLLPGITPELLEPQFECLKLEFKQTLDAFAECFREGDCSREFPTVQGTLKAMDRAIQQLRDGNLLGNFPSEASLRLLDSVNRYHATADALNECGRSINSLRIECYWGDYSL